MAIQSSLTVAAAGTINALISQLEQMWLECYIDVYIWTEFACVANPKCWCWRPLLLIYTYTTFRKLDETEN